MRISAQNLLGQIITGPNDEVIGEIAGHIINTAAWRVELLRVRLEPGIAERIGIRRSLVLDVPIDVLAWSNGGVVLATTVDGLRQALTREPSTSGAALA